MTMFEQPLPIAKNPEKSKIEPENPTGIDYESEIQNILDSGILPAEIVEVQEERFSECRNPEDCRKVYQKLLSMISRRENAPEAMSGFKEEHYQENAPQEKTALKDRMIEILEDASHFMDEGQVGKVFDIDGRYCCKYIYDLKKHGLQNELSREISLQRDAHDLSLQNGLAKVPMPMHKLSVKDHPAFVMEKIDGLNLRKAASQRSLPEGFDPDAFFDAAIRFIDELNGSGLHHRDLHGGNLMIDWPTGKPVLIDFGTGRIGLPGRSEEDYRDFDPLSGSETAYRVDAAEIRRLKAKYVPIFREILKSKSAIDK